MSEQAPAGQQLLRGYGIAAATVATALLVTFVVQGRAEAARGTYALFAAAVVVSAYLGGFTSGLMATGLAALASDFFQLQPLYSLAVAARADLVRLGLFLVEGVCLSGLAAHPEAVRLRLPTARTRCGRYGLAVLAVLAALGLKLALAVVHADQMPFLLFAVAVLFAVITGGRGPGLLATLLAAFLAAFFFFEPRFSLRIDNPTRTAQFSLFVLEGCTIALLGDAIHALRRRAEAAAQELDRAAELIREQAALLDQARDAIVIQDSAGRLRYWNRGAELLYGRAAAEVLGQPLTAVLPGAALPEILGAVETVGEWRGDLTHPGRTGQAVVVESRWTRLLDAAGQPCGSLLIGTDATERRRLQEQAQRAQRLDTIGAMATGIVHDLNNALAPLAMGVSVLKGNRSPEFQTTFLDIFGGSIDRATGLLRQILAFARGGPTGGPQPLRPLLQEVLRFLGHTLPRSVRVEARLPVDLWAVPASATQVSQILLNLCVNARDAMPEGGRLTVQAENLATAPEGVPPGACVLLTVTDTGHGIAPENLPRVFEPYFTTKPPGQGTGLGLATTRDIVTSLGGALRVASSLGQGATFRVYLPALAPQPGPVPPLADLPPGAGELVLIVEDEASLREIAGRSLQACGYRTATASTGAETLAQLAGVAVILLDLHLPDVDGLALLRRLRELAPSVPVILTTGGAPVAPAQGEAAFLAKPYSVVQLLETLRRVLQR